MQTEKRRTVFDTAIYSSKLGIMWTLKAILQAKILFLTAFERNNYLIMLLCRII